MARSRRAGQHPGPRLSRGRSAGRSHEGVDEPDGSNHGVVMGEPSLRSSSLCTPRGRKARSCTDAVEVGADDVILNKPRYGAFHGTDF